MSTGDPYYDGIVNGLICDVENGRNVFLTGPGGVGKSFAIKEIVKYFVTVRKKSVSVTATTGIAAIPLGIPELQITGSTIHAWAGVGLAKESAEKLAAAVEKRSKACEKWRNTQILVIDEVSMLGADFLEKLDFVGKHIRRSPNKTFGGIILILVGDFYQLPPINDEWVFRARAWEDADLVPYILDQPKRYDHNDPSWFFFQMRMRIGCPSASDLEILEQQLLAYQQWIKTSKAAAAKGELVVKPTVLHSKKVNVETENEAELLKLPGPQQSYHATDLFEEKRRGAGQREYYMKRLDDTIPEFIVLKVGAQVMLKANLDLGSGLGNGSRGVILELGESWVKVRWLNGLITVVGPHVWVEEDKDAKASRSAIPLILAWSLTIHKCVAGDTLIEVEGEGLEAICSYVSETTTTPFRTITTEGGKERLEYVPGWYELKRPISIRTSSSKGKGFETVSRYYIGQEEETLKIRTEGGYCIEGSHRHPIMVGGSETTDDKWVTLPEIKLGDQVKMSRGSQKQMVSASAEGSIRCMVFECEEAEKIGLKHLTPELAKIFALIIGTGPFNSAPRSSPECAFAKNELDRAANAFFGVNDFRRSSGVCDFLKVVGCDVKAFGWASVLSVGIPWMIMRSPSEVQLSYVKGIFSTFGSFTGDSPTFTFPTAQFARDFHQLLLSLGARSKLEKVEDWGGLWKIKVDPKEYDALFDGDDTRETYFSEKVISVTRTRTRVYDFEVPGTHTFITNGFVSHNCQGSTLEFAIVDVGPDIFEEGQAYVALSRVQSQAGLLLKNYSKKSIRASKVARKFMDEQEILFRKENPYPENVELVSSGCLIFADPPKK